jgi:LAO/AO transport system kinase
MSPAATPAELAAGLVAGDRRSLAKAITLVESTRADHQLAAQRLLEAILPRTGAAVRLGITGVPGVGKSTFIEAFGLYLIEAGHRVAILAVDPSSQRSGGSILGDKTRMPRLAAADAAFIRPSPTSGSLGGVARHTREALLLCEAAGYDVVLVETVGVGQSEYTVASMVDFFLLLMLPGAGDELQGIKRGIMELADGVVINKADGDNVARAERARAQYAAALRLLRNKGTWEPPVMTASALQGRGMAEAWSAVLEHRGRLESSGELEGRRRQQQDEWFWSLLREGLEARFLKRAEVARVVTEARDAIERGEITPTEGARRVLELLGSGPSRRGR